MAVFGVDFEIVLGKLWSFSWNLGEKLGQSIDRASSGRVC